MYVHFSKHSFLECYEDAVLSFKNIHNKEKDLFRLKNDLFYLVVFVNKALDKVYSKKLRI